MRIGLLGIPDDVPDEPIEAVKVMSFAHPVSYTATCFWCEKLFPAGTVMVQTLKWRGEMYRDMQGEVNQLWVNGMHECVPCHEALRVHYGKERPVS
jgi:hypothetical protein